MRNFIRPLAVLGFLLCCYVAIAGAAKCDDPPVIVCQDIVIISLDVNGEHLFAFGYESLIEGQPFDECTKYEDLIYKIIIPSTDTDEDIPPNGAGETWLVDCKYLGYNTADIWVGDDMGNWSKCTVAFILEDKFDPNITCPEDITISCAADHHDLSITGELKVNYVCDTDVKIIYEDKVLSEYCSSTVIKRTWMYIDKLGNNVVACKQIITKGQPFAESYITWPEDIGLYDCSLKAEDVDPVTLSGEPTIIPYSCSEVYVQYEDKITKTCEEQYTIQRTWRVLDWCKGELYAHVQEIVLTCSRPPVAYCTGPLTGIVIKDGLIVYAQDFDSGSYDLCDLDIFITVSINGGPFEEKVLFDCADLGTHKVVLKVENEAGEVAYCETEITIIDKDNICDGRRHSFSSTLGEVAHHHALVLDAVDPDFNNTDISIYPNPTSGILNVKVGSLYGEGCIIIYDNLGSIQKMVRHVKSHDHVYIDTQQFMTGSKMLFVELFDGRVTTIEKVLLIK